MTSGEFEAIVRRYFRADDLTEIELRRLYVDWNAFAADRPVLAGLERKLRYENGRYVFMGSAWWEELYRDVPKTMIPIDDTTRVKAWLAAKAPGFSTRMRPHCPEHMLGTWRCVGSKKAVSDPYQSLAEERAWTLGPDGESKLLGFPELDGCEWRYKEASRPEILFGVPGTVKTRSEWRIYKRDGADDLHVFGPGGSQWLHMQRQKAQ